MSLVTLEVRVLEVSLKEFSYPNGSPYVRLTSIASASQQETAPGVGKRSESSKSSSKNRQKAAFAFTFDENDSLLFTSENLDSERNLFPALSISLHVEDSGSHRSITLPGTCKINLKENKADKVSYNLMKIEDGEATIVGKLKISYEIIKPKQSKSGKGKSTKSVVSTYTPSNPVIDFILKDLRELESSNLTEKITIIVHKVFIPNKSDSSSFPQEGIKLPNSCYLKIKALPLPGRETTLRSISIDESISEYNFNIAKPASLSISASDLKSKLFKGGACPRLCLDLFLGTPKGILSESLPSASAALYLPTLLKQHMGKFVTVPLRQCSLQGGGEGIDTEFCVKLEVLGDLSHHSNSVKDTQGERIHVDLSSYGSLDLEIIPKRLAGIEVKEKFRNIEDYGGQESLNIEATLSIGRYDAFPKPKKQTIQNDKAGKNGFQIGYHDKGGEPIKMVSICPSLDIITVNFCDGEGEAWSSREDQERLMIGFIMLPVCLLTSKRLSRSKAAPDGCLGDDIFFPLFKKELELNQLRSTAQCLIKYENHKPPKITEEQGTIDADPTLEMNFEGKVATGGVSTKIGWGATQTDGRLTPCNIMTQMNASLGRDRQKGSRRTFESTTGQILVGLQGMYFTPPHLNPRSPLSLKKKDSLYVEVTILPEGLKKRTPIATLQSSWGEAGTEGATEADMDTNSLPLMAKWNKALNLLLVWALQQRQVSSLLISIVHEPEATTPTTTAPSSKRPGGSQNVRPTNAGPGGKAPLPRRVVGSCYLDLAGMMEIALEGNRSKTKEAKAASVYAATTCLVPIRASSARFFQRDLKSINSNSRSDAPIGCLMLGLKFTTASQDTLDRDITDLENRLNDSWQRLSTRIRLAGVVGMPNLAALGIHIGTPNTTILGSTKTGTGGSILNGLSNSKPFSNGFSYTGVHLALRNFEISRALYQQVCIHTNHKS